MDKRLIIGGVVILIVIVGVALAFTQGSNVPAVTATNTSSGSDQGNSGSSGSSGTGSSGSSSGSGSSGGSDPTSGGQVDPNNPQPNVNPDSTSPSDKFKQPALIPCTTCGGKGYTWKEKAGIMLKIPCTVCGGSGWVKNPAYKG